MWPMMQQLWGEFWTRGDRSGKNDEEWADRVFPPAPARPKRPARRARAWLGRLMVAWKAHQSRSTPILPGKRPAPARKTMGEAL